MDTTLWLHNKLGTSNDSSWTSGSICSQLNKEVLKNIKECFPDLQTQVKLKLLLSFFHIPRRHVEEVFFRPIDALGPLRGQLPIKSTLDVFTSRTYCKRLFVVFFFFFPNIIYKSGLRLFASISAGRCQDIISVCLTTCGLCNLTNQSAHYRRTILSTVHPDHFHQFLSLSVLIMSHPPLFAVEEGTRGDHRGGRHRLGALGVDDSRDDEDVPRDGLFEHRNFRLRRDASHFHRHGQRSATSRQPTHRPQPVAARVSVPEQGRLHFCGKCRLAESPNRDFRAFSILHVTISP